MPPDDGVGLPPAIAAAAERLAAGLTGRRLAELTRSVSDAYRSGSSGAPPPALGRDEVAAYCAYRLPATYAAVRAALAQLHAAMPSWSPAAVLDLGGGPGAGALAAASCFGPGVARATVVDANAEMLRAGEELAAAGGYPAATTWQRAELGRGQTPVPVPADAGALVLVSYLLGELDEAARDRLVGWCASSAAAAAVVVEPGTPAGFERVLRARAALVGAGWTVAAPCPHEAGCPITPPDWCHFAVRLPRSHMHRAAKGGALAYEDEKFSYVAAVREPVPARPAGRIVRHPTWRRGVASLEVCGVPSGISSKVLARSAGEEYRAARRSRWGDPWPPPEVPAGGPA